MKYALYQASDTTDEPGEIITIRPRRNVMGKPMDEYKSESWG